jgi:erythromycin esterase-like protein
MTALELVPLSGAPDDHDALLADIGDRPFVLLGESTHGTREFYRMRAAITRRLIDELGFDAVVVEADWPDAMRVNRYVHGSSGDPDAATALGDFERFPRWMWRNHEVRTFVEWLRERNRSAGARKAVGFYGLDLYSLYRSAEAVIRHLERTDPGQAALARRLYDCLDGVQDAQQFGYQAAYGMRPDCRDAAVRLLTQLAADAREDASRLDAPQNARVVANAEPDYRAMFSSRDETWNLRDTHMADTLFALREWLRDEGRAGRLVVWAHNSHVGDARATQMAARGELNLGQLVRERAGEALAWIESRSQRRRVSCGWPSPFTLPRGW